MLMLYNIRAYQNFKLQPTKAFMMNLQIKYGNEGNVSRNFVRELTTMGSGF